MSISSVKTGAVGVSLLAGNTAFDPAATWLIQRVNGTGSATSITFSNIPQTYQHLQIRGIAKSTSTSGNFVGSTQLTFNSSSTYYYWHNLSGNGSSAGSNYGSGLDPSITIERGLWLSGGGNTGTYVGTIIDIHDYTSTTKNKVVRLISGADNNDATGNSGLILSSGYWTNTSAVTSITLTAGSGNFTSGTTYALYGIKGE